MDPQPPSRFDLVLSRLARELSTGRLACGDIAPTASGDLIFGLTWARESFVLVLGSRPSPGRGATSLLFHGQTLFVARPRTSPRSAPVLRLVAQGLERALQRESARKWLDRRNRNIGEVPLNADGLAVILGDLVSSRQPFWGTWFVDRVAAPEPGSAAGRFSIGLKDSRGQEVEVLFSPGRALSLGRDSRTPGAGPLDRPELALGYCLAKGTHEGIRWSAPPPPAPAAAPAPQEEKPIAARVDEGRRDQEADWLAEYDSAPSPLMGLLENCLRTYGSSRGFASRFFNVWGDIDHFGITAAPHLFRGAEILFHSNRECAFVDSALSGDLNGFVSPWKVSAACGALPVERVSVTDLDDASIVRGGEEVLGAAIAQSQRADPERDIVVIGNCDYHMIGDDIDGVCKKRRSSSARILHLNPAVADFAEVKSSNWWRDFSASVPRRRRPASRRAIGLAGLGSHDEPQVRELQVLLERLGIKTEFVIFPGISPGAHEGFGRASAAVLSTWHPVRTVLEPVLGERGLKVIRLDAPYGVQGTLRWLGQVSGALGLARPGRAAAKGWAAEFAPDFARLQEQARGVTVGLVADLGTLEELCSPEFFFGFDPCSFFTGLGFKLKVFQVVYDDRRHAVPEALRRRHPQVEFGFLRHGRDYGAVFREHGLCLVYCDICGGQTVKRAGAAPMAVDCLRPGLSGAQETLRQLLALAKMGLYPRFGRFLGAPRG